MKKTVLVLLLVVYVLSSCTKQASNLGELAQEEATAKGGNGKGKNKNTTTLALSLTPNDTLINTPEKLLVVNVSTPTQDSISKVAFTNPTVNSGDDFRWTFIDYGVKPDDSTFIKMNAAPSIWQTSWIQATGSPLNPYRNGNGQIVNSVIPAGVWAVRVVNVVFEASGRACEYHSVVTNGFLF